MSTGACRSWRRAAAVTAAVLALVLDAPAARAQHGGAPPTVTTVVTQTSTDKQGYETYQVGVMFGPIATDVYALYGQKDDPLIIPPAYQVATPFGTSVGPVNKAFVPVEPDCAFDSWLTIGVNGPALIPNALSSVGLPLDDWSETQGINADNGAVFFMDPSHGATTEPVVFAQLTVPAGTSFSGQVSAQGRSSNGQPDWDVTGLQFDGGGAAYAAGANAEMAMVAPPAGPPPPPPPPPMMSLQFVENQPVGGRGGRAGGRGRPPAGALEVGDEDAADAATVGAGADCTVRGLSGVSSSCPPAAPGSSVPSSCPTACANTVNSWYRACTASRAGAAEVRRTDHLLSGELMTLVNLCAPPGASTGTGGGH